MIISKVPVRISLFGGTTDYDAYLENHNGLVVGTTINQYIYLACRFLPPFFDYKTHLTYSKVERLQSNKEIEHKAIKAVVDFLKIEDGLELCHMCDLPSKSGIGSSSAFIVGLLHNLKTLLGHKFISPKDLYDDAGYIENTVLQECVGRQDRAWASYGGFKSIHWREVTKDIEVRPIPATEDTLKTLENNLLLFCAKTKREKMGGEVASKYATDFSSTNSIVDSIYDIAEESVDHLRRGNLDSIGKLLHESWLLKRSISDVISNSHIDEIYNEAIKAGAIGGKLIGAGSGGNILLYVPKEMQGKVRQALSSLIEIPFCFEKDGSSIILNTTRDKR